jgi:cytochrome c peroxidase
MRMKHWTVLIAWAALAAPGLAQWPSVPGYAEMKYPADNAMSKEKVELGKQLYFDKRLSADGTKSCYSCHVKEKGLTDGLPTAIGAYEAKLPRAAPTMWNVGYYEALYWDGRSPTLERQVLGAMAGGNMGATGQSGRPSVDDVMVKIGQIPGYKAAFEKVFGPNSTNKENMAKAVAAFMRTIVSVDSPWFRFNRGQNPNALNASARRGWTVFDQKAKCTNCHDGLLLTDQQFHNAGIGMDAAKPDVGRFTVSKQEKDTGAFKTPTLLDISKSAPYFHDGSAKTLEEAVDVMVNGGKKNQYLDTENLKPVTLTAAEKTDLLAFLRSLEVKYTIPDPKLP